MNKEEQLNQKQEVDVINTLDRLREYRYKRGFTKDDSFITDILFLCNEIDNIKRSVAGLPQKEID